MVALSSCEAEYIAASMTTCQAQWINMLLMELQLVKDEMRRWSSELIANLL